MLKKFKINNKNLNYGFIGLKAINSGFLNKFQIETIRKNILNKTNRKIKIWINLNFNKSITKKSLNSRMGSGKGKHYNYVASVKAGSIFFEIAGNNKKLLFFILKNYKIKIPIKTKIIF